MEKLQMIGFLLSGLGYKMKEIITGIDYDAKTNLPVVTDVRGNIHIVPWESINKDTSSPRYYLQSWTRGHNWASTTNFNSIPDSLHPGSFLVYTVPENKCYNVSFIMAAQAKDSNQGMSVIGFFTGGVLRTIAPLKNEVHYVLYSPISVPAGVTLELKYMPFDKKCDLGIIIGGPLIDCV
jgi:hypothetical protein